MDVIKKAREMCKELTQNEEFIKFQEAKKNNDNDKALQELIGEFNLIRMSLDNELKEASKNKEKMDELNDRIRTVYTKIMENETMIAYNDAKAELDGVVGQINDIINLTISGQDPETCSLNSECTGSCATCGGCH